MIELSNALMGMCPDKNRTVYNKATFLRLVERDKTEPAISINRFRVELVRTHLGDRAHVLDIGIGAGTFLKAHGHCLGFDINRHAVNWLKKDGLFFDPYWDNYHEARIKGVCFFDSLEHIVDPGRILCRLTTQRVFVSIPIFHNKKHVYQSKHFKPGEHLWYFTRDGFLSFMAGYGFAPIEERRDETDLGREDIKTFVFKKRESGNGR